MDIALWVYVYNRDPKIATHNIATVEKHDRQTEIVHLLYIFLARLQNICFTNNEYTILYVLNYRLGRKLIDI